MSISSHTGMGAIPYGSGVTFRVWAPFAQGACVAGEFNSWSDTANPLSSEGNGYWSCDVTGAKIGQQYKYIITNRDNGNKLWRIDPYAREVTSASGNAVIIDPDFDWGPGIFNMPPWNEMVIYEIHIGTFNREPTDREGSFQGVIDKLGYLKDLGINTIEIMASGEFATDTSWGYNPAYIYAIETAYGGAKGFKQLIKAAHDYGIAIIFDVVYNHLGYPALDMWQFDGWSQNGKGGIYFYNDWRSTTPWGDTRLDYGRREVRQYLLDNALMWMEKRQVDGLRWDATGFIRNVYGSNNDPTHDIPDGWNLMRWINSEIKSRQPWKVSIAEDMQNNEWITKDAGTGGADFDAQWDASFVHTIRTAIIASGDQDRNMYSVRDAIYNRFNGNTFERVIYTESHDEDANGHSRVPEEIWPGNARSWFSKKRSTIGAALVFTVPGIPMIFQGQEFLEDRFFSDTVLLDWNKKDKYGRIVNLYRDLIHLRRNWFNNTRGLRGQSVNVHHVNDTNKVIAFHRWDQGGPGDDVLVIINMANKSFDSYNAGFPRQGLWKVRFNSDWNGYSSDFGNHLSYDTTASCGTMDGMPYNATVGIGPYSVIILSQDN
jgi:1,4-alpha-glucan branching enzyme